MVLGVTVGAWVLHGIAIFFFHIGSCQDKYYDREKEIQKAVQSLK